MFFFRKAASSGFRISCSSMLCHKFRLSYLQLQFIRIAGMVLSTKSENTPFQFIAKICEVDYVLIPPISYHFIPVVWSTYWIVYNVPWVQSFLVKLHGWTAKIPLFQLNSLLCLYGSFTNWGMSCWYILYDSHL